MNVEKVKIKRGNKENLPILDDGEMALCVDTGEIFIGNDGNSLIGTIGYYSGYASQNIIPIPKMDNISPRTYYRRVSNIPIDREGVSVIYEGCEYALLFGGYGSDGIPKGAVERICLSSGKREKLRDVPTPRRGFACISYNKKVFLIGGRDSRGKIVGDVEVYDILLNSWSRYPDITPREYIMAEIYDNDIHCIGGRIDRGRVYTGYDILNVRTMTWRKVRDIVARRAVPGICKFGNTIMISGGEDNDKSYDVFEEISVRTNSWSKKKEMPYKASGFKPGRFNGVIYAVGGRGYSKEGTMLFKYIPATNEWICDNLKRELYGDVGIISLDDGVYVFGGKILDKYDNLYPSKYVIGRVKLMPVNVGDVVWSMTDICTESQLIPAGHECRIKEKGMLYIDKNFEYGWIRKVV